MDPRKSVHKLDETIHSLLGLKSHLTSSWVKSVCDIIKSLPYEISHSETIRDSLEKKDDDMSSLIPNIEDELAFLTSHINQLNAQRRQVLNDLLDLKGNIRVFCRIRPITSEENFGHFRPLSALDSSNVLLKLADNKGKTYSFDKVFGADSSQDEVFSEVEPVIKSALDGYNACIFAYGQTGTGKTFTMEGTLNFPGVVPRAIEALFKQAVNSNHAFLFSFSMLEIYLGNLKDLLVPHPVKAMDSMPPCLSIRTDLRGEVEIDNLVAIQVNDFNQAMKLYRLGCRFRSTASTNSNTKSSRSHCLIRLSITCYDAPERRRETNKVWLIDLGGSERVLKTKAWGRRLDEGKAINLSLSALGDVINALQKKNGHVPYRNSKLTQVLKDSLGEDSKSLMLVHVSPKEEDLCETICSLNFATRVRSIHLGMLDSAEEREQKENAMMNLQQKMKMIEDERQDIMNNIKKLHVELENLMGTAPSSNEEPDASHSFIEMNQYNAERMRNKTTDNIAATILQVPRFMRPTFCSRGKSGINHQLLEDKAKTTARRRRPLSRAESVGFPVKCTSAYNSDCSISRTSCLMGLNVESSADNGTEYTQDEYDIKKIVFPEQETSPESSVHGSLVNNEGCGNRKVNNCSSAKYLKVDNWLRLHKKEPTISGSSHQSKRVLAIPVPEKKHTCNGQKKDKLQDAKEHYYKNERENISNLEKLKGVNMKGSGRSIQRITKIDTAPILADFVNKDSRCDLICASDKTDGDIIKHAKGSLHGQSMEESKTDSPNQDNNPINKCVEMQEAKDERECSNYFWSNNSERSQHSKNDVDYRMLDAREDSGLSISKSEQEPHSPQVPADMGLKEGKKEGLDNLDQSSAVGSKPSILEMRSQRGLFAGKSKPKDLFTTMVKSKDNTKNSGIYHLFKEKIQILWATALLGMGFQTLGLEHDFFHGLML
ncbi:kinesin-like protein KIN-14T isoform X1 [Ziziphus jujuba]|uniref:Kinesin-like protein KIN-14T isoform X1 n=2 Tax=Ziziphus jujuba TaxID=326968 RepID=A0A6P6G6T6_ZIZJJ|nr:kinesin-like protein KIN-14T isoform X1 [Ziziphus jujuba]XP_024929792.2 kinesin-like protein KIN-14T isoform X1 [Ziziphus jujuba]XP_024929793.2 kinesin-like protein KIN-14T isoform X1 [Ziziphus jujuba]XP_024929796.2 kinesin-like protein KIN-14T isoform X1 [Ziziphus jujuba]XP_060672846.1 kinesin-like protein KIN-14T isoform X1 [Ziziphus jujuba]